MIIEFHNVAEYEGSFKEKWAYDAMLKDFIGHEEYYKATNQKPPTKNELYAKINRDTILEFVHNRKK